MLNPIRNTMLAGLLLCLGGTAAYGQEREYEVADWLMPQIVAPKFTATLLEVTPARLNALEATLKEQGPQGDFKDIMARMDELRRQIMNAKSEAEAQRLTKEMTALGQEFQSAAQSQQKAHARESEIWAVLEPLAEAYAEASEAVEEWRNCMDNAGVETDLKIGAQRTAEGQRLVEAAIKAEREACGKQPGFPDAPAPVKSWTFGARAWYTMLDRVLTFCNTGLFKGKDGLVGAGGNQIIYTTYTAAEAALLSQRCEGFEKILSERGFLKSR